MSIFLDTNVLLDVLMKRQPHLVASAEVWSWCETGRTIGFMSAISFNNVFYVVRKLSGSSKAMRAMALMRDIFKTVEMDAQVINQAIDAQFDDFEDAIQYFSAVRAGAQTIITRNGSHFVEGSILAVTPEQFLATRNIKGA